MLKEKPVEVLAVHISVMTKQENLIPSVFTLGHIHEMYTDQCSNVIK